MENRLIVILGSVGALLLGTTILLSGQGLFLILVPTKLGQQGFAPSWISGVATAYFAGYTLGAWFGGRIIRRVGHIRVYGGLLAIAIASALALPLEADVTGWLALRFLYGASIAGVYLVIESWLNAVIPNKWRGRVLSIYTALSLGALGAGQLLINVYPTEGKDLFLLGGIVLAISIVPVVLSRVTAPEIAVFSHFSLPSLFRLSPFGIVSSVSAGLMTGAFWALTPLFGVARELSTSEIALLMAFPVFGGLFLQLGIGYLSDRMDRRTALLAAATGALLAALAILFLGGISLTFLLPAMTLFGGMTFALYPLALSHAVDQLAEGENVLPISAGLLIANGAGMAVGPLIAGQFFDHFGANGLIIFFALTAGWIISYTLWRISRHGPVPEAARSYFVPVGDMTTMGVELDPRIDPEMLAEESEEIIEPGGAGAGSTALEDEAGPPENDTPHVWSEDRDGPR